MSDYVEEVQHKHGRGKPLNIDFGDMSIEEAKYVASSLDFIIRQEITSWWRKPSLGEDALWLYDHFYITISLCLHFFF